MFSRFFFLLFVAGGIALGPQATAQTTGLALVKANNCLGCHQVQGRRVGPAFSLIAKRFHGQEGAQDYLAGTIRSGGRGRWGPVPMPAQPQVTAEQSSAIAAWILSLGGDADKTDADKAPTR